MYGAINHCFENEHLLAFNRWLYWICSFIHVKTLKQMLWRFHRSQTLIPFKINVTFYFSTLITVLCGTLFHFPGFDFSTPSLKNCLKSQMSYFILLLIPSLIFDCQLPLDRYALDFDNIIFSWFTSFFSG